MPTNINWAALIGALSMILAYIDPGYIIPPDVQASVVTLIGALTTIAVWFLHTFWNTAPEDRPKALGFGRQRFHTIALVCLALAMTPGLFACTTVQGWVSGSRGVVSQGLTGLDGLMKGWVALCVTPAAKPAICTHNVGGVRTASADAAALAPRIVATLKASGDITALEMQLGVDVATIAGLFNDAQAKSGRPRLSVMEWAQIFEVAVQVGQEVWQAVQAASGGLSDDQLDALVNDIEAQNAAIQGN